MLNEFEPVWLFPVADNLLVLPLLIGCNVGLPPIRNLLAANEPRGIAIGEEAAFGETVVEKEERELRDIEANEAARAAAPAIPLAEGDPGPPNEYRFGLEDEDGPIDILRFRATGVVEEAC